jgi:DNA mismatch repair protein MSH4
MMDGSCSGAASEKSTKLISKKRNENNAGSLESKVSRSERGFALSSTSKVAADDATSTTRTVRDRRFASSSSVTTSNSRLSVASSSRRVYSNKKSGSSSAAAEPQHKGYLGGVADASTTSHIVCAISENLARETCMAILDASTPVELNVVKQGNGNTYAETLSALEWIKPDEVLLNEGRMNSQLAQKVLTIYREIAKNYDPSNDESEGNNNSRGKSNFSAPSSLAVVKFVPRNYFDQTRGSELLQRVCRERHHDSTVVNEYILLASCHAVLHYASHCLGAIFAEKTVNLYINAAKNQKSMVIDRNTLLNLELLSNARTGNQNNSLLGSIDSCKTSVGSRLLRRTLMAPPTQVSTINARLDLVDELLSNEEFFYEIFDHLRSLPELDRMLSHMALVPRLSNTPSRGGRASVKTSDKDWIVTPGMASRGISALVCIKTALSIIPKFADSIENHLKNMEARENQLPQDSNNSAFEETEEIVDESAVNDGAYDFTNDDGTALCGHFTYTGEFMVTPSPKTDSKRRKLKRNPAKSLLLRAILYTMRQPSLKEILDHVCNIFTESTTYSRNPHAMRHQECFAIKPNIDGMMDILRKAFLANVDDIYRLADEYAEKYGLVVSVKETTARGYYLSIPSYAAADLPSTFIQPVKSGRFIHCSTEEVRNLQGLGFSRPVLG